MKIDPYYQGLKFRPVTVVSGDIRFIRIFAGFVLAGESNDFGGCRRRQWLRLRNFENFRDTASNMIMHHDQYEQAMHRTPQNRRVRIIFLHSNALIQEVLAKNGF